MAFRTFLLLTALAVGPMVARPLAAQDELHLGELYRAVLAASPRIAAADARAGAAAARVASTRRPPDPELQFGAMGRSLPGLGYSDPLGMDQLQLMQMVPFPGKLGAAGQAAQARAEAARAEALDVAWGVRARAAERFYAIYRIGAQLAVARETRRLLQDITRTAAAMYGVGEGRQTDLLRAQVELARMDEEIIRLEAERTAEAAGLNALLARGPAAPMGEPVLPAFPDTLPALDSLLAEAASRRPMVQADAAEVRAADADARRARRELWPDLQLGVQYAWRPMPGGGSDRMGSLMVGVTLPVFAGSRQLAMRRETEAMAAMARARLTETEAASRGRVGEVYAAIERARRLAALYRTTILPEAEAAARSAQASYRVGAVDFMTLLDDQMTVNGYRQELVALEAERGAGLAELEMLLGRALFVAASPAEGR